MKATQRQPKADQITECGIGHCVSAEKFSSRIQGMLRMTLDQMTMRSLPGLCASRSSCQQKPQHSKLQKNGTTMGEMCRSGGRWRNGSVKPVEL